jgi:hypothetical protein
MFKKRKDNQNKTTGRKRKIFATIAVSLSLLFAKPRLSFSRSSSPNFDNQVVQERVIEEREFNLLEENDRQIILAKAERNPITPPINRGPNSFPTPPSGGRPSQPSRPATGTNPYIYRTLPKVVDQGLGGAPNPAGAGGGENFEFDDSSPASQKLDEINSEHRSFYSKKKKSAEQCELEENSKIEDISQYISEFDCTIDNRQIQKKYKHAIDFKVPGNYNPENAQLFKDKIIEHMKKPSTQIIEGTFKNIEVTHYFDSETGLNVFFNRDNKKFISGWLLKDDQLDNMVNRGSL